MQADSLCWRLLTAIGNDDLSWLSRWDLQDVQLITTATASAKVKQRARPLSCEMQRLHPGVLIVMFYFALWDSHGGMASQQR